MDKIHQSLIILFKCYNGAKNVINVMDNPENQKLVAKGKPMYAMLYFYYLLEVSSFFEEYNKYFISTRIVKFKEGISRARDINKPIVKYIKRRWPNIEEFRNSLIAHPWRDSKNGFEFISPDDGKFKIPRSPFEFGLLFHLLDKIMKIIKLEFKIELKEAFQMVHYQNTVTEEQNYSEISEEMSSLEDQVNQILVRNNINAHIKFDQFKI